jgi:hypothetical protein
MGRKLQLPRLDRDANQHDKGGERRRGHCNVEGRLPRRAQAAFPLAGSFDAGISIVEAEPYCQE